MHAYFRVFTGTRHVGSIDLHARPAERLAVMVLAILILGGGLYPQPGVTSRYEVASELVQQRQAHLADAARKDPRFPGSTHLLRARAPNWH
jgi:NADH-quinone oxidoreductase subunit M